MKQYDKIYVEVNQMSNDGVYLIATYKTTTKPLVTVSVPIGHQVWLEEHKSLIALTVQDMQDLWNAAQDRACALQIGDPGDTKIFEAYL